jgi:hypothetical protein
MTELVFVGTVGWKGVRQGQQAGCTTVPDGCSKSICVSLSLPGSQHHWTVPCLWSHALESMHQHGSPACAWCASPSPIPSRLGCAPHSPFHWLLCASLPHPLPPWLCSSLSLPLAAVLLTPPSIGCCAPHSPFHWLLCSSLPLPLAAVLLTPPSLACCCWPRRALRRQRSGSAPARRLLRWAGREAGWELGFTWG